MRRQLGSTDRVVPLPEEEPPRSTTRLSQFRWAGLVALIREDSGSNLVETAIVLPMFFRLVFSIVSFALLFFAYCNATYAARTGVRYAVVHSSTSLAPCDAASVQGIVTSLLWGAPIGGVMVTPQWSAGNTIGIVVSVTVQMTYTNGLPYLNLNGLVLRVASQGVILH
jgi:Flp pilus assembly protein TadG